MSQRVKIALFNTLGSIEGKSFCDPFAGSGALGFEAVSRGAHPVQLIDIDAKAYRYMKSNAQRLAIEDSVRISRANCKSWLKNNKDLKFDIVIADPPFDALNWDTISAVADAVAPGGTLVVSLSSRQDIEKVEGMLLTDSRMYGDQTLAYFSPIV